MASVATQKKKLEKIIQLATTLLADIEASGTATRRGAGNGAKRIRRTGKELVDFRKKLKAERKKGTPVAEIAKANGVSAAYVYQL